MKFVRYHNVVMPSSVKNSFQLLAEDMYLTIGVAIEPIECFKTGPQIARDLIKRIKKRDLSKRYDEAILESMDPLEFEPPLVGAKIALRDVSGQELVQPIPNKPSLDPRRSGRLVQIGPKNIINPTTLYYLVHNAGKYGFVHYGPLDPSIWYWRGDLNPGLYTPQEVVSMFTGELSYLL